MTNSHKTTTYQGLALLLGAVSLVAVACSDDEDAIDPGGQAGKGGTTTAGATSGGTPGKAGSSAGGKANGGTAGGTAAAGGGMGGDVGIAGDGGGGEGLGGDGPVQGGAGGDATGGGAGGDATGGGGDEGGAGGGGGAGGDVVADTLDNGTFAEYDAGWSESGDLAAATTRWIYGEEPGLNHWADTAYQVATFQTVSPLPNGTYAFSMEVNRAAGLTDQYLFAKGCTAGDPDGQVTQSTAAASDSGYTKITLSGIVVSSGSCTVGIYTDAPAGGWANIDNALFVEE